MSMDKILSKYINVDWLMQLTGGQSHWNQKEEKEVANLLLFRFCTRDPNHSGGQFSPDGLIKFNRLETVLQTLRNGRGLKTPQNSSKLTGYYRMCIVNIEILPYFVFSRILLFLFFLSARFLPNLIRVISRHQTTPILTMYLLCDYIVCA